MTPLSLNSFVTKGWAACQNHIPSHAPILTTHHLHSHMLALVWRMLHNHGIHNNIRECVTQRCAATRHCGNNMISHSALSPCQSLCCPPPRRQYRAPEQSPRQIAILPSCSRTSPRSSSACWASTTDRNVIQDCGLQKEKTQYISVIISLQDNFIPGISIS